MSIFFFGGGGVKWKVLSKGIEKNEDGPTLLYHPHVKHCHHQGDTEHQVEELVSTMKQGVF